MKTRTIKSLTMRTLVLLLLFVTGYTFAQPVITTPTDYVQCDANNDFFEVFDLTVKNNEITLDPGLVINYYETLTDAQIGSNFISNPTAYANIASPMVIYVRAFDPADPGNPSFTSFNLILNPQPISNTPPDIFQVDIPFDGHSVFDLTVNETMITGGVAGVTVMHYPSLIDAQNDTNPIAAPAVYINTTNPQTVAAKVQNPATGCFTIVTYKLVVTNPDIVYIPDTNFKWELVNGTIATDASSNIVTLDTNGDGEIQVTEATLAYRLDPTSIATTTYEGIRSFSNLQTFHIPAGAIINTLDLSGLQNLKDLSCNYNQLTTLNITNCPALETIFCGSNFLTALDLTGKPALKSVWCEQNSITSLDVTGAPLLQYLSCRNNFLPSLDLTNNTALTDLNCGVNLMTSLDLSNCVNLVNFHCAGAPIQNLDFTGLNTIENLNVRYTDITSLDVSNLVNLTTFNCDGITVPELDLSNSPYLCSVNCANTTLTYLNIKNGNPCNSAYILSGNTDLQFVCADEDEADYYQNYFADMSMSTIVSSYCTFTPGGNYNTITGQITFDANNNGCDAGDSTYPNIRLNINDSNAAGATFTNATGNYTFYTQAGSFDVAPVIENPSWFNFSPVTATIPFIDNDNNTATQNFCLSANGIHPDLEIVITPITPARPGFDAVYKIVYKNKGNQIMTQSNYGINFFYNQYQMSFTSASVSPLAQLPGSLSWDYANLKPFESRSILVTFLVNAPSNANPVNIGDVVTLTSVIFPQAGDEIVTDNTFVYNQTVVGAFDPNDITCLEGESVAPTEIGKYLHYNIRFENTGNYAAENVVIKDEIDATKYDVRSLQIQNTSHSSYTKITGNKVEFIFENINLAAAGGNPPVGGHGDVLFKIKSKNTLVEGDYVSKSAKIYFDYNAPIETNDAQTTFQSLSNPIHELDNSVTIYPNPAQSTIYIKSKFSIQSVQLYDVAGRLLETDLESHTEVCFDISNRQAGIYFLKITSEKGSKVEKVIKE